MEEGEGIFYNHFGSKDELYAEAVRSFISCNPFARQRAAAGPAPSPAKLARLLIELDLSDEVFGDVEQQCPLYALPSDVARAGLQPRAAYTELVQGMLHVFRAALPGGGKAAERKALLIVNLCVGGMVLARTTNDPELSKSLRAAARGQALALLDD